MEPGQYNFSMATIRILPPETARLIAAGEVIDRPAAVLREFLDNAIDAGASSIAAEITGGGTSLVRVADNGSGMDKEDLGLSILPHATSKIATADDLLSVHSLGFRGEALASIAAAARLEITSRPEASAEAYRLVAGPGIQANMEAVPGRKGTQAQATRLFEDYPARKQFLKRSQAEASICKQVFLDKALAHPDIAFTFMSEGRLSLALPPASPEARVSAALGELPPDLVYRVRFSGPSCEGSVVIAAPAFYRDDRRLMEVFVNRRRVQDPGLIQALDYAFQGFLPGGAHPAAILFAEVDPACADFNIHPAKKEVRFKDVEGLRHAFVHAVQSFLLELSRKAPEKTSARPEASFELPLGGWTAPRGSGANTQASGYAFASRPTAAFQGTAGSSGAPASWDDLAALRERVGGLPEEAASSQAPYQPEGDWQREAKPPRYLGKALGLFLVAESGDALYLIDQHAAHERILYNGFMERPPEAQELLVPAVFEAENSAEEERLEAAAPELSALGFGIVKEGSSWLVTSLPAPLDRDPVGAVREILAAAATAAMAATAASTSAQAEASGPTGIERGSMRAALLATAACRAAVKDGDELEADAAARLAFMALGLPEPRCPHGRPVWVRITRDELYRLVRRTV